jgi:hypothetical protein
MLQDGHQDRAAGARDRDMDNELEKNYQTTEARK